MKVTFILLKVTDILLPLISGKMFPFIPLLLPTRGEDIIAFTPPDLGGVLKPTFYRSRSEKMHFVALNLLVVQHAVMSLFPN